MSDFRLAPEGQPTDNIELQLKHAKLSAAEWRWSEKNAEERFLTAVGARRRAEEQQAELEWQLEQRKATEVNGL